MPSFVIHGILPLLVLLAIRRLDARKVWALWPLTFVPDVDYFFGFHRATLGNVFILVPFLVGLGVALAPRWRNRELAQWMGIALVYLATHLLMDVFAGGSVLLYPFSDYTICYVAAIEVVTATNQLIPYFEPCSREGIPEIAEVYTWLSVTEGAMLAFLLPAALVVGAWHAWGYVRERRESAAGGGR